MNNNSNRKPAWLVAAKEWPLPPVLVVGLIFAFLLLTVALDALRRPAPEPLPPPIEEPEPWRGRMECKHGGLTLYTVNNLVDFIVSAQPSGWMWEMFKEDGTVVLFHQPERVFCSAVPEE